MKRIILLPLLLLTLVFALTTKVQAVFYPISDLGKCRDAQECRYYCEIPENTPTCWSYGKYVLQKNVLGEQTESSEEMRKLGVTFPVAELGNCASAQACKEYCSQAQNQEACKNFALKRGLTKKQKELKERQEKAKEKEGILIYAKKELGCSDQNSCRAFCEIETNREKCMEFAKRRGLGQGQKAEMQKERMSKASEEAKQKIGDKKEEINEMEKRMMKELQCQTKEACVKWCKENSEKCSKLKQELEKKLMQTKWEEEARLKQKKLRGGCTTEKECYMLCKEHPEKCPGFPGREKSQSSQSGNMYFKPVNKPDQYYPKPSYTPSGIPVYYPSKVPETYPEYSPKPTSFEPL